MVLQLIHSNKYAKIYQNLFGKRITGVHIHTLSGTQVLDIPLDIHSAQYDSEEFLEFLKQHIILESAKYNHLVKLLDNNQLFKED